MDDDKLRSHSYTDSPLTTYELIKQVEIIARTSRNMDVLIDYMLADISYRKERSELYKRISSFLTGTIIIGAVGKLGAIVIGLIAPFIIQKVKIFIMGL